MDIIIDIQGFLDTKEKFIPKEVALVAINVPIIGHWIMTPPYSFVELCENSRRQNTWLSRNYHGIEWFDGETKPECFTQHLREIIRETRFIYCRGEEKASYLRNLLSRTVYNLEGISPSFKNLRDKEEDGQRCSHHGFRNNPEFHCALRNVYALKRWFTAKYTDVYNDSSCGDSCFTSPSGESGENEKTNGNIFPKKKYYRFTNKKSDVTRKVEAWLNKPIREEEEEEGKKQTTVMVDNPAIQSTANENAQESFIPMKEEKSSLIFQPRTTSRYMEDEHARNFTSVESSRCRLCGSLSCRQTAEGVDENDSHCR